MDDAQENSAFWDWLREYVADEANRFALSHLPAPYAFPVLGDAFAAGVKYAEIARGKLVKTLD